MKAGEMGETGEGDRDAGRREIGELRAKLAEARGTARAIYEAFPDPSIAEGAYEALRDALDALGVALDRLGDRPTGGG
jgi:hypothetical protein